MSAVWREKRKEEIPGLAVFFFAAVMRRRREEEKFFGTISFCWGAGTTNGPTIPKWN